MSLLLLNTVNWEIQPIISNAVAPLLAVQVGFWIDCFGAAGYEWQIDGYGCVNGLGLQNPPAPLCSCAVCFLLSLSLANCKSLLFKHNLKTLHCCLLWPSVNNVLLLSSDWREVKARPERLGLGTLFPRQPVVLFTLMPFTLIFTFGLPANQTVEPVSTCTVSTREQLTKNTVG